MERLTLEQVLQQLQPAARRLLDELIIKDSVESTNDYLLTLARQRQVVACFAEHQTVGRGQHGKRWIGTADGQIYFSLLWHFQKAPSEIMGLSLACGVSVVRALRSFGVDKHLSVKWPNDIFYKNRKLAGVLVEIVNAPDGICSVVIGVGINLYSSSEQVARVDQPWASLDEFSGPNLERNRFAGILLNEILLALKTFTQTKLFSFQEEWRGLDYLYGKRITLTSAQQSLMGIMRGISANGEILLIDDQQQQHACLNGSVRLAAAL